MDHLGPFMTIWDNVGPLPYSFVSAIAIWSDLEPLGAIWSHLELFGAIWSHLEPFGAIWRHLEPFGAIWSHLQPYGAYLSHLEPFWAIWSHLEQFGAIFSQNLDYLRPYKNQVEPGSKGHPMEFMVNFLRPFRTIWEN